MQQHTTTLIFHHSCTCRRKIGTPRCSILLAHGEIQSTMIIELNYVCWVWPEHLLWPPSMDTRLPQFLDPQQSCSTSAPGHNCSGPALFLVIKLMIKKEWTRSQNKTERRVLENWRKAVERNNLTEIDNSKNIIQLRTLNIVIKKFHVLFWIFSFL